MGRNPMDMMDREKAYIPALQLGFLDGIAIPVFQYALSADGAGVVISLFSLQTIGSSFSCCTRDL